MFVFEVSSEAGHKVGGIYTVLLTKSKEMVSHLKDNYLLIGKYDHKSADTELEALDPPADFEEVFRELETEGIKCYYGRWIKGHDARLILVDACESASMRVKNGEGYEDAHVNVIKYALWKQYGIESMFMGGGFDEEVVWAHACGKLLEKLVGKMHAAGNKEDIVAHFHEWIAGTALLYVKSKEVPISTVFTTHATTLGRTKVTFGADLMREISEGLARGAIVNQHEAYDFKLEGKHFIEKACAKEADVFTTVSETIARECEYILGVRPRLVTPNGMEFGDQVSSEKAKLNRIEVENLVNALFLPYCDTNMNHATLVFTAARYEFANKGIDFIINALGQLNRRLSEKYAGATDAEKRFVYAFIFVPSNISGPPDELIENLLIIDRIDEVVSSWVKEYIPPHEFSEKCSCGLPKQALIEVLELKKNLKKFASSNNDVPILSCFNLRYEGDKIVSAVRDAGLLNRESDFVRVIFYPTYLRPGDGLLNMRYLDVMSAFDVGLFPSRYEPWGYTPVEAASQGSMSLTTDVSGFGAFLLKNVGETKGRGIRVVHSEGKSTEQVSESIADILEEIVMLEGRSLKRLKIDAQELIRMVDWKNLVENYFNAYNLAIESKADRKP